MARLQGIQKGIQANNNNSGLLRVKKNLQGELRLTLQQAELMWFQRSREKWLSDGDRNMKYYHLKTVSRRRGNKILMLKDNSGSWIADREQLKELVNDYYKNLFSIGSIGTCWKILIQASLDCWKVILIL